MEDTASDDVAPMVIDKDVAKKVTFELGRNTYHVLARES